MGIYVANEGSGSVSAIYGSKNVVITTITRIEDPVQLLYNPSNDYIYIAGYNSNSLSITESQLIN